MSNYLYGNTPSTIYKQLLSVGGTDDRVGLTSSLKAVWTDDGAGSANASAVTLGTNAVRLESSNQLRFRDDAIYIYSSGDTVMNLVADGEIDLATAAIDINATSTCAIDNTNTSNGVQIGANVSGMPITLGHSTSETTVADNLTVTGTTAHTGIVTMASGVKLQFVDGNEYVSGNSSDLSLGASSDINLYASNDVNIPNNVGLVFGDDGEKIEGDGTNLAVNSSGALNLTGAANSTWKTSSGSINIDAEASTVEIDGHSGVNIVGNAAEVDITTSGAVDINSGAFSVDGAALSIDGTDDSNITVTGIGKDLTIAVAGGGDNVLRLQSAGTGANAMDLHATAGGIDIRASGAAASEDIDITATGSSVNITSTENVADSIVISSSLGGIDITASNASAGEDIDITATGSSINLTSTENAASAIYLRANGGTSETIKIHSDQGTGASSVYLLSDVGGVTIDGDTDHGVKLNTNVSGAPITIGHTTSETTVADNLTVTGDLAVSGTTSIGNTSISTGTKAIYTFTNTDHENSDRGRDSEILFKGEKLDGTPHELGSFTFAHDGSSDDYKGSYSIRLNGGGSTSLSSISKGTDALFISSDNTATFGGAVTAGTNVMTCGQLNSDNTRLDGNTLSTTDSNGDLLLTPNGSGGVALIATNAPGSYSFSSGYGANASGNYAVAIGDTAVASNTNSVAIGDTVTASTANSTGIGTSVTAAGQYATALGYRSKADRKGEVTFSTGFFGAVGDTRCAMFHEFDTITMSSSWASIDGGTGGITFDSDTVAVGHVLIVGSTTGAARSIGFRIDFLAENDGGSYSVVQSSVTSLDSEDTSFNAQVTIDGSKLVAQVTDAAVTDAMRWTAFWQLAQHTF